LTEALEGALDGRVVALDFGDLIPLAARAEVVKDNNLTEAFNASQGGELEAKYAMDEFVSDSVSSRRFNLALLFIFAVIAL